MKLITQFKNWVLDITGHKNSPTYTIFICIIIIMALIANGYGRQVEILQDEITTLNEEIKALTDNFWIDQVGHMDEALQYECGKKIKLIDSLYIEISTIGMELDSMKLRYDN